MPPSRPARGRDASFAPPVIKPGGILPLNGSGGLRGVGAEVHRRRGDHGGTFLLVRHFVYFLSGLSTPDYAIRQGLTCIKVAALPGAEARYRHTAV
jgi:hypothetical protein